jgi:Transposase zinc-binding domain
VIRAAPESFFQGSRNWFTWLHQKVLTAILRCRTSALGGHVDECSGCGHHAISFNSCRNRHCPRCRCHRVPAQSRRRLAAHFPCRRRPAVKPLVPGEMNAGHAFKAA